MDNEPPVTVGPARRFAARLTAHSLSAVALLCSAVACVSEGAADPGSAIPRAATDSQLQAASGRLYTSTGADYGAGGLRRLLHGTLHRDL